MLFPTSPFPSNSGGDVKIVLSERDEDVLMLDASVLAKESSLFKASLECLEWSYNKSVTVDAGKGTEHSCKLLELELETNTGFGLLIGKQVESAAALLKRNRENYDRQCNEASRISAPPNLAPSLYDSETIIIAYKIGFAMMYGRRIIFASKQIRMVSRVIPVVLDFADAYGLLAAWNDKILSMTLQSDYDLNSLVVQHPFHCLKVAYKLQSKSIYQEAVLHGIGLRNKYEGYRQTQHLDYLREVSEQVYLDFEAYAKDL